MTSAYISFWDKEEPTLKITIQEYQALMKLWNPRPPATPPDQVWIRGDMIHRKDVRRIYGPKKPEPLSLPSPTEKPISKKRLAEINEQVQEIIANLKKTSR